jgi:redox-sensitive bicupin YhaK (pirin superfamily)
VLSGEVAVNGADNAAEGGLVIFDRSGNSISVRAQTNAKLLVMDGEPIAEPVVGRGPFVMNTHAEIEKSFEEYQRGLMGEIARVAA